MRRERPSRMWGRCTAGNQDAHCNWGNHDRVVEVQMVTNAATMQVEQLCGNCAEGYRLLNRNLFEFGPGIVPGDRHVPKGNVRWHMGWHMVDRRPPPRATAPPPDPW